ncbi:translation initiation factor subunit [Pseudozyma hubeiensis SY62]|uniref:Translation initiation factor subunit n=1 Tax=Pseudozyma hubeiensis (strain SY62) TaxID=1305764 RepID=R9P645_PSEHS|nr:translation initiation factor subunit [Pseudozyma hubeiensis SY62]GAC96722.1 translation initiation factor subunit [Pseudozyma hubeiensis SY62]
MMVRSGSVVVALLADDSDAGAVEFVVAVAAGADEVVDVTGIAVITGTYQTLPLNDAEAVRLEGSDCPLERVVVMVDTTVVEVTTGDAEVDVCVADEGLPEAEICADCCCA